MDYIAIGDLFKAREGKWIGAKVGLYALRNGVINAAGIVTGKQEK